MIIKDGDKLIQNLNLIELEMQAWERDKRQRYLIWLLHRIDERNHELTKEIE